MISVGSLAFAVLSNRPLGNVDVMRAPVGQLAARVFVPPAKLVMTSRLFLLPLLPDAVIDQRRLAEPLLPIQVFWHVGLGNRLARRRAANGALDALDLPQPSRPAERDRPQETMNLRLVVVVFAPLLSADLKDAIRFVKHLANLLAFSNGQRQRLLAVNVFPSLHRFDGDFRMPMVGRDNGHHVDVFAVEYLAVVFKDGNLVLAFGLLLCRPGVFRIDVADSNRVGILLCLADNLPPAAARADATQHGPLIRTLEVIRPRIRHRKPERNAAGGCRRGRRFQKVAPILEVVVHRRLLVSGTLNAKSKTPLADPTTRHRYALVYPYRIRDAKARPGGRSLCRGSVGVS